MTPGGALPAQLYLVGSNGADDVTATYSAAAVTFDSRRARSTRARGDAGGCDIVRRKPPAR